MNKGFKRNVICFVAIFLTLLSSIALPFISYVNPEFFHSVNIKSAHANVQKYNKALKDGVSLSGEWEFFWGKHIVSSGEAEVEPDLIVELPSSWTSYEINEKKLSNGGIASYRTTLTGIKSAEPILVSVQNMPGECRVYIDGKCVFSNRSVPGYARSKDKLDTYASPVVISNPRSSHTVVIEAECNFSSGVTAIPVLSTYNCYQQTEIGAIALRYVLIGIVAFFCVGVCLLAVMQRRFDRQIWLVLLCIVFIFRMLITNEGYMVSQGLFMNVNYEIMTSLTFVSTYIIKLCMMMYLVRALKLKVHSSTVVFIAAAFLLCAFVPYFLYDYIYISTAYMWLQSVAYIFDAYMIFKISDAIVKKVRFAPAHLIVYCITAAAIFIDNCYLNGFISERVSAIMPMACMIFIGFMVIEHFAEVVKDFKKAQKAAELEKELSEINMTLMLSQIQPHFLYNALNTIKYLTKKDAKAAETAIVKFSSYLRANMDSLTQKEPIEFIKELEHVRNYIDIEKLRFGDRLNVEYDIDYTNFAIPPLTIQPIVENAIKYGVNQKPAGGTVKISSYEQDSNVVITISDDGVGFDVMEEKNDGRSHIGIQNIKKRLTTMLGARVTVESEIDKGTTVTITIPGKEAEQ